MRMHGVRDGESGSFVCVTPEKVRRSMLYPVVVGALSFDANYRLRRRELDNYMVADIREGEFRFRVDHEDHIAKAGQFVLIDCRRRHDFWTVRPCTDYFVHFNGPAADGYYSYIVQNEGNVVTPANPGPAVQSMRSLIDALRTGDSLNPAAIGHRIDAILACLASGPADRADANGAIGRAVAYIAEHVDGDLSIDRLADVACLSRFYFAKAFAKATGLSPHRYVLEARIGRAKIMLSLTPYTVARVGRECGFPQSSAFCAAFKRIVGMSPTEYRRRTVVE